MGGCNHEDYVTDDLLLGFSTIGFMIMDIAKRKTALSKYWALSLNPETEKVSEGKEEGELKSSSCYLI